jgi:hypothetical protein
MGQVLLKDRDWRTIDGEACRVLEFTPWAKIEGSNAVTLGKRPYASVTLQCRRLSFETTGFITRKVDFYHLWLAFKEREIEPDEEVIIFWTRKPLRGLARLFSSFMPRLWVTICKKGAYDLMRTRAAGQNSRARRDFSLNDPSLIGSRESGTRS